MWYILLYRCLIDAFEVFPQRCQTNRMADWMSDYFITIIFCLTLCQELQEIWSRNFACRQVEYCERCLPFLLLSWIVLVVINKDDKFVVVVDYWILELIKYFGHRREFLSTCLHFLCCQRCRCSCRLKPPMFTVSLLSVFLHKHKT